MDQPGARRIALCQRGLVGPGRDIELDLRRMAFLVQFAFAVFLALAARHLRFRGREFGFGDFDILTVLLRVEPGKKIALLYRCPNINRPLEDFAVDPKADIGLVARLDLAG